MSRGILMFAHNNGLFDYGKMAYAAALAAKYHICEPVTLVTDDSTWNPTWWSNDAWRFFDDVIFIEPDTVNERHFDMVDGTIEKAAYHNTTRFQAYELSPYDETLLIDSDVLVQDPSLQEVWGSSMSIRMNRKISELVKAAHGHKTTLPLSTYGIDTLWATIMYFQKDNTTKELFELCQYVSDNYQYFSALYGFPSTPLRVDFVVTIAAHIMSGYNDGKSIIDSLPTESTLFAWNKDILVDVDNGRATFITDFDGQKFPVVATQTVHCMNKDSMLALADRIIECYA